MAESAKRSAQLRRDKISDAQRRDLRIRWNANSAFYSKRNFDHELAEKVSKAAASDPLWKGYVEDNKWYIQQAIMYGIAVNNELLSTLIAQGHHQIFNSR